jgi:DNA-binding response OmpR family regulator
MLPDKSGEDICRFIRSHSRIPVLMLTAKADEASLLYGFRVGADDFMTKPFSPRELMVRIEALLRRSQSAPAAQLLELDKGRLRFDRGKRRVWKDENLLHLTAVEFDILEKLISYPGRIFSREEILQAARGGDFQGTDRTVDSHIRNLRSKIEETPKNPHYILTERGKGFYFNG